MAFYTFTGGWLVVQKISKGDYYSGTFMSRMPFYTLALLHTQQTASKH